MAKFIVKKQAEIISEFELDKPKPIYFIGSDMKNDFVISDNKVSIKHLKIQNIDNNYYIQDLNSAFGTTVNGNAVSDRVQIFHNDEIGIGPFSLIFEEDSQQAGMAMPQNDELIEIIGEENFIRKSDVGSEDLKPMTFDEEHQLETVSDDSHLQDKEAFQYDDVTESTHETVEETNSQTYTLETGHYLLAIDGPQLGKKFTLRDGDTKIGRDTSLNDIVIRNNLDGVLDPSISRRHATICLKDDKYYISDKRSKTRTFVNQIKLGTEEVLPLRAGDEIEIVSDQQSTIFRLLKAGDYDISPPKKAGEWWTRNKFKLGIILTIVLGLIAIGASGLSCNHRLTSADKPDNLQLIEETWFLNDAHGPRGENEAPPWTSHANLATADINGDKNVDLVFVAKNGSLVALDGTTKRALWKHTQGNLHPNKPLVLADLNANNLPDILVVSQDARLLALDGINGAEIWFSPILGASLSGPPVVSDFDGDGAKDVLVCTENGQINLGHGGVWSMNWEKIETGLNISSVPSSIDWDGDGIQEIFVGSEQGQVAIIDGKSGTIIRRLDVKKEISDATGSIANENSIQYPIALSDLNNDGITDMVIGTTAGNYLALEGRTFRRLWAKHLPAESVAGKPPLGPAISQFDDDGIPDVVIVSNKAIHVVSSQNRGQSLWQHTLSNDFFCSPPALTDMDKDGVTDVLIATQKGAVIIFNGKNGEILGKIESPSNPVRSSILTADLGGDRTLDVIFVREDGHIHKIQSNSPTHKNSAIWGQAYANSQHTAAFGYTPPKSTNIDITIAVTGIMFFMIGFLTFSAKQKRTKLISSNQNA